jgi:hypothetical protein
MKIRDDEYTMKPLYEGCGCGGKKLPVFVPSDPSPIINESTEHLHQYRLMRAVIVVEKV